MSRAYRKRANPRRDQYIELRRRGLTQKEAAREVGLSASGDHTYARYEKWFQALESGDHMLDEGGHDAPDVG